MMNEELIVKYIVGEADKRERLLVETWIAETAEHKEEFETMKKVWDVGEAPGAAPEIDIDTAWTDFVQMRAMRSDQLEQDIDTSKRSYMRWMRIAAAVLLVGTACFWGLRSALHVEKELRTGLQVRHSDLPDGSTVYLNAQTALRYEKVWLGKNRNVQLLRGEVFFDVKRDEKHPFVIQSGNSRITVLGTSFHVRRDEGETEVIVSSGAVKVSHGGRELVLKPDQMLIISDSTDQELRIDTVPDKLYRYYVHQEFIFENTPMSRVFEVLGKAYGRQFSIDNPRVKQLRYTATFEQQSIKEIMDVITKTFDLKVTQKNNTYHIN